MQIEKIAEVEQANVLHGFWYMMKMCEDMAMDNDDVVLKRTVKGLFNTWNRVTGDTQVVRWETKEKE